MIKRYAAHETRAISKLRDIHDAFEERDIETARRLLFDGREDILKSDLVKRLQKDVDKYPSVAHKLLYALSRNYDELSFDRIIEDLVNEGKYQRVNYVRRKYSEHITDDVHSFAIAAWEGYMDFHYGEDLDSEEEEEEEDYWNEYDDEDDWADEDDNYGYEEDEDDDLDEDPVYTKSKEREERNYLGGLKSRLFTDQLIELFEDKDYDSVAQLISEGYECINPIDLQTVLEDYLFSDYLVGDSISQEDIENVLDAVEEANYSNEHVNFTSVVEKLLETDQKELAIEFCKAYPKYID